MSFKKWLFAVAVLPAMFWAATVSPATKATTLFGDNVTYVLFGGGNPDSTEQLSDWIPVAGARRIIIRTWSAKAAFHASTDADSTFSDSLITFKVAFSDSMSGNDPLAAADSVLIDYAIATTDTAFTGMGARPLPINKQLRGPSNGSGLITEVYPMNWSTVASGPIQKDAGGVITKKFMRVLVTPLRRMTVTGSQSTAGKRVNGLKGFRMWATLVQ